MRRLRDRDPGAARRHTPAADDCLDGSGGATGSTRYFYHQDANYRVAALTNESGTVVERYEYEAYGEPRVYVGQPAGGTYESGALVSTSYVGNPLMHQGLRRDDETGLHENRYRMLHSRLGRFMQRDRIADSTIRNYEYLDSAPGVFADPLGLAALHTGSSLFEFCKALKDEIGRRLDWLEGELNHYNSQWRTRFTRDPLRRPYYPDKMISAAKIRVRRRISVRRAMADSPW